MRKTILLNEVWRFIKENVGAEEVFTAAGKIVNLPHTWNAIDGQDGGGTITIEGHAGKNNGCHDC